MAFYGTIYGTNWTGGYGGGAAVDELDYIVVTPNNSTSVLTAPGTTVQFLAEAYYTISGGPVDVTGLVDWFSSNATAATIVQNPGLGTAGLATADTPNDGTTGLANTTVISAVYDGVTGTTNYSVDVDRDATSGRRVPSTVYQLGLLGLGDATAGYLCQDVSGNAQDFIGTRHLVEANTPGHGAAVSGWTRLGLTVANNTGQRYAHATWANAATASFLAVVYGGYNSGTVTAGNQFMTFGGANDFSMTSGDAADELKLRYREGANIVEATTVLGNGPIHPWTVRRNLTLSEADAYTSTEHLSPTFGAAAGTVLSLGCSAGSVSGPFTFVYALFWDGAVAEKTDAQVKTIHTVLNWAPSWT